MSKTRGTSKGRRKPQVVGYPSGADAPLRAVEEAVQRAMGARRVLLVEGLSDQIAIEAAAVVLGCDLAAEGVVVVPAGGVGSIGALAVRFGPQGVGLPLGGLCDAGRGDVGLSVAGQGGGWDSARAGAIWRAWGFGSATAIWRMS